MRFKALAAGSLGLFVSGVMTACSSAPDYSFLESTPGQNIPTIHCLALHACAIRFKAGETIQSFTVGDPDGWTVKQEQTGSSQEPVSILLLLPKAKARPTNILVTTSQTLYNFGLNPKR